MAVDPYQSETIKTYFSIAQGTVLSALSLGHSGDLKEKGIQKRGDICIHIEDSLCCTVETNTTM